MQYTIATTHRKKDTRVHEPGQQSEGRLISKRSGAEHHPRWYSGAMSGTMSRRKVRIVDGQQDNNGTTRLYGAAASRPFAFPYKLVLGRCFVIYKTSRVKNSVILINESVKPLALATTSLS